MHINYPAWSPDAPFGGYKRSGNGREYGVEGLEEYLETKAILGFLDGPDAQCRLRALSAIIAQRAGTTMTVALRAASRRRRTRFRPLSARRRSATDDPFARHREIAWEGPDSMIAGRVSFIGELDVASFPHIETIVVVEGELDA